MSPPACVTVLVRGWATGFGQVSGDFDFSRWIGMAGDKLGSILYEYRTQLLFYSWAKESHAMGHTLR